MDKRIYLINRFVEELKKVRSDVLFRVSYFEQEDRYFVYHSYANIHEDKEYRIALNRLYTKHFSLKQVFSVSLLLDRKLSDICYIEDKALLYNDYTKSALDPHITINQKTEPISTNFTEYSVSATGTQTDYRIKKNNNETDMELAA